MNSYPQLTPNILTTNHVKNSYPNTVGDHWGVITPLCKPIYNHSYLPAQVGLARFKLASLLNKYMYIHLETITISILWTIRRFNLIQVIHWVPLTFAIQLMFNITPGLCHLESLQVKVWNNNLTSPYNMGKTIKFGIVPQIHCDLPVHRFIYLYLYINLCSSHWCFMLCHVH